MEFCTSRTWFSSPGPATTAFPRPRQTVEMGRCRRLRPHLRRGGLRLSGSTHPGSSKCKCEYVRCSTEPPGSAWESFLDSLRWRASRFTSPETALREGRWVKLICGASFEDVAEVRNLSLLYTLAGVDCIDCAADSAVVAAVAEGVQAARDVIGGATIQRPWIMISINDDEDPHFRKAGFNSAYCPSECSRPCESVCPASAIQFEDRGIAPGTEINPLSGGVIMDRCYGCGRCLPVCPVGLISAKSYLRSYDAVKHLILNSKVDAIEIHTGAGHLDAFATLVAKLGSSLSVLKLVAVSVPDMKVTMISAMVSMYAFMQPFLKHLNLWQLDGRPMSGDIGAGATIAAVSLAERVAASPDRPPGYLQLAGGTNAHTGMALKKKGLFGLSNPGGRRDGTSILKGEVKEALIAGVGYGGYARKVVGHYLKKVGVDHDRNERVLKRNKMMLENYPWLLKDALEEAIGLVDTVKDSECNGSQL